jgi:hypothetical protein
MKTGECKSELRSENLDQWVVSRSARQCLAVVHLWTFFSFVTFDPGRPREVCSAFPFPKEVVLQYVFFEAEKGYLCRVILFAGSQINHSSPTQNDRRIHLA